MRAFQQLRPWILLLGVSVAVASAQPQQTDPFAGVAAAQQTADSGKAKSWKAFFVENLGFRKEIMSQFDTSERGRPASRQSVGFEVLKKFSTTTSTFAAFNFQGRLVRRDGYHSIPNDMEGESRTGWAAEYHNLYLDFYNVFNPLLNDGQRRSSVGRFNIRLGRFYVPFGLNLQTDTHGTLLQLSNGRNFGYERDWYTGLWGSVNRHLNYDAYYLAGSGYDLKFKGQSGLGALRLSLSNRYSSAYGLEAGVSLLGGERLPMEPSAAPVATRRIGMDARYRRAAYRGLLTFTSELSGGRDDAQPVISQLYQTEYLHRSRRWGLASQYRRLGQKTLGADASIIGEFSWYFRNDVGNSNLHWIKFNVERQLDRVKGRPETIMTLQYYFYR